MFFSESKQAEVWEQIETVMDEKQIIPQNLKNLLAIQGFNSVASIRTINEESIADIELFAQTILPSLAEKNSGIKLTEFLDIYAEMPSQFKFSPGHKNIIAEIKRKLSFEKAPCKLQTSKRKLGLPRSSKKIRTSSDNEPDACLDAIRNERLKTTINNWIKKNVVSENRIFVEKTEILNEGTSDETSVIGKIYCPACDASSRVHLQFGKDKMIMLRQEKKPHLFLVTLFQSQTCEKNFRRARSMTSTFSTVINFSVLDFMHKTRRIEMIGNISNDFKEFNFPRNFGIVNEGTMELPSDTKIEEIVLNAKVNSIEALKLLGIDAPQHICSQLEFIYNDEILSDDSESEVEPESFSEADSDDIGNENIEELCLMMANAKNDALSMQDTDSENGILSVFIYLSYVSYISFLF